MMLLKQNPYLESRLFKVEAVNDTCVLIAVILNHMMHLFYYNDDINVSIKLIIGYIQIANISGCIAINILTTFVSTIVQSA